MLKNKENATRDNLFNEHGQQGSQNQPPTTSMNIIQESHSSSPSSASNSANTPLVDPDIRMFQPTSTLKKSRFRWFKFRQWPFWLKKWLKNNIELNFYRCHLLTFIFVPCIFAIIFYLAHDSHQAHSQELNFFDCLFMCYSAMTMTGLTTILLAPLNRFQQVLLYVLMSVGSTTIVSVVMVYIRLGVYKQRFHSILNSTNPPIISRPILPDGTPPHLTSRLIHSSPGHNDEAIPNPTQPGLMLNTNTSDVSLEPSSSRESKNRPVAAVARPSNQINHHCSNPSQSIGLLESHGQTDPSRAVTRDSPLPITPVYSDFPFKQPTTVTRQRRPLVRWNSDGGVVGARSSFTNVDHHSDSSQLDSTGLLSILKPRQMNIPDNTPSSNITFDRSPLQSTPPNQAKTLFPRSVTLDQPLLFQQIYYPRVRAASRVRGRCLTFAHGLNPVNLEHQVKPDTSRITASRFIENDDHVLPFSSLNRSTLNHRSINSTLLAQPGMLPSIEPESPCQRKRTQSSQQWAPRTSFSTGARDTISEGLRRRIKPQRTSSAVSNPQPHGLRSASNAIRGSRFFQSQDSIYGPSNYASNRKSTSAFPRTASIKGFGGFPNPIILIIQKFVRKISKAWFKEREHSLEFVRTSSLGAPAFDQQEKHKLVEWLFGLGAETITQRIKNVKTVSYIKFNAIVGRNSNFLTLSPAQEEELGGLEYRALLLLIKILIGYWVLFQVLAVVILIPYLETPRGGKRFSDVFEGPGGTNRVWYAIWITCSSFTNGGMSLIDAGFTVFRDAYFLMVTCSTLIIAGNTGYPIILRAIIWTFSKFCAESTPEERRKVGGGRKDVLNFLLDHPRRCFVYLFPSQQTWYLFFILLALTCINWVGFLLLNIGNPKVESIPIQTRIVVGLLQSLSVRAAGFSTVSLGDLAPALQVLFLIMMYIAVYPMAISIRATNVYEERSMGIFDPQELHQQNNLEVAEEVSPRGRDSQINAVTNSKNAHPSASPHLFNGSGNPDPYLKENGAGRSDDVLKSTSSYFAFHIRQQLAFDIWWLALAVWLICIAERSKIVASESANSSFSIFSIIFEVVSAYGTIGLSVGLPDSATSMVGGFSSFSKLVVILVMLRGRHRGLPIAIDRAVLFPFEVQAHNDKSSVDQDTTEKELINEHSRQVDDVNEIQEIDSGVAHLRRPIDIESQ